MAHMHSSLSRNEYTQHSQARPSLPGQYSEQPDIRGIHAQMARLQAQLAYYNAVPPPPPPAPSYYAYSTSDPYAPSHAYAVSLPPTAPFFADSVTGFRQESMYQRQQPQFATVIVALVLCFWPLTS